MPFGRQVKRQISVDAEDVQRSSVCPRGGLPCSTCCPARCPGGHVPASPVCSCSPVPAGRAVAALHSLGRCPLPGSHSTVASPRAAGFACSPSEFRLQHAGTARVPWVVSAPGAQLLLWDLLLSQQPGDHSPSVLLGTGLHGCPQGSAVCDLMCSTAV